MSAYIGNTLVQNFNVGGTQIVALGGGTFFPTDTDAVAFISASQITGSSEINSINYLVSSLKLYNLWDKMVAFYPFVGSNTGSMKWNLKNPLDTDAALRLTYYGGVSATPQGLKFNGTQGTFADTHFYSTTGYDTPPSYPPIASYLNENFSAGVYSETTGSIIGYACGISNISTLARFVIQTSDGLASSRVIYSNTNITAQLSGTQTGGGLFVATFTSASADRATYYRNETTLGTNTSSRTFFNSPGYTYILGGSNDRGNSNFPNGVDNESLITLGTAFLGSHLNPSDYQNLNTIVQGYNNILGRKIVDLVPTTTTTTTTTSTTTTSTTTTTTTTTTLSSPVGAFVTATGLTGSAVAAVQDLYDDLVNFGIWNKMVAIYPFVGANANAHRYNLKNTGSLNLTFTGGWTHNSNGVTNNGSTGYASTGIIPNGYFEGDTTIGVYSRTAGQSGIDFGSVATINPIDELSLQIRNASNVSALKQAGYTPTNGTNNSGLGLFVGNVYSALQLYNGVYANGVKQGGGSNVSGINFNNQGLYIGARNNNGTADTFAARNYAFALFGNGLTPTEQTNLYTAIQDFQIALNRQV